MSDSIPAIRTAGELHEILNDLEMSQDEFAEATGLSRHYITIMNTVLPGGKHSRRIFETVQRLRAERRDLRAA